MPPYLVSLWLSVSLFFYSFSPFLSSFLSTKKNNMRGEEEEWKKRSPHRGIFIWSEILCFLPIPFFLLGFLCWLIFPSFVAFLLCWSCLLKTRNGERESKRKWRRQDLDEEEDSPFLSLCLRFWGLDGHVHLYNRPRNKNVQKTPLPVYSFVLFFRHFSTSNTFLFLLCSILFQLTKPIHSIVPDHPLPSE